MRGVRTYDGGPFLGFLERDLDLSVILNCHFLARLEGLALMPLAFDTLIDFICHLACRRCDTAC